MLTIIIIAAVAFIFVVIPLGYFAFSSYRRKQLYTTDGYGPKKKHPQQMGPAPRMSKPLIRAPLSGKALPVSNLTKKEKNQVAGWWRNQ